MNELNIALSPWAPQKLREDMIRHYQGQVYRQDNSPPAPEKLERAKLAGLKVLIGGRGET